MEKNRRHVEVIARSKLHSIVIYRNKRIYIDVVTPRKEIYLNDKVIITKGEYKGKLSKVYAVYPFNRNVAYVWLKVTKYSPDNWTMFPVTMIDVVERTKNPQQCINRKRETIERRQRRVRKLMSRYFVYMDDAAFYSSYEEDYGSK